MNKSLIFLIISTSLLVLSAVVICVSPIINNIEVEVVLEYDSDGEVISNYIWSPSSWRNLNCKILADKEKADTVSLDDIQRFRKYKNICYRQKAMYGLEYSVFVINIILSFVCADLTLLHYLNVGKDFEKKTGLIGLISGIIGFILTLVYVCFSGYIFTKDAAYGNLDITNLIFNKPKYLVKLFPNGAKYKKEGTNNYITVDQNDKSEYANILLYKDLGQKQYNYNSDYFEKFKDPTPTNCNINDDTAISSKSISCDYLFYTPNKDVKNKYIYDRWLTALILSIIIVICNISLIIFGFLLFKSTEESSPSSEQTPIVYKK